MAQKITSLRGSPGSSTYICIECLPWLWSFVKSQKITLMRPLKAVTSAWTLRKDRHKIKPVFDRGDDLQPSLQDKMLAANIYANHRFGLSLYVPLVYVHIHSSTIPVKSQLHVYELTSILRGGGDGAGLTGDNGCQNINVHRQHLSCGIKYSSFTPELSYYYRATLVEYGIVWWCYVFNELTCCRYRTTALNPMAVTTFDICLQMICVPPSSLIRAIICSKPCMSSVWQHLD